MRKVVVAAMVALLGVVLVGEVFAATYKEIFLGSQKDDRSVVIWQNWKAVIGFNLNGTGSRVWLRNPEGEKISAKRPVVDEKDFVPDAENITSARLSLTFSSTDVANEKIKIWLGAKDGDEVLVDKKYTIGERDDQGNVVRAWKTIILDLNELGLLNVLQDGRLVVKVTAPELSTGLNDFRLEQAKLLVVTE